MTKLLSLLLIIASMAFLHGIFTDSVANVYLMIIRVRIILIVSVVVFTAVFFMVKSK